MKRQLFDVWGKVDPRVEKAALRLLTHSKRTPGSLLGESADLARNAGAVTVPEVAKLLNDANIKFIIIGASALGVFTRMPRATKDVDVVVPDVAAAVKVLRKVRTGTRVQSLGAEIGMRITNRAGEELIDVLFPSGGVRGQLFRNFQTAQVKGIKVNYPTLSAMVALKYVAMFGGTRGALKRERDFLDLKEILQANPKFDPRSAAAIIGKTNLDLAKQFTFDMAEYKAGREIKLYPEPGT